MPGVAGVCLIQNAIDAVPALVGHYLRLGFDRLLFLDDGSTDGTRELLGALARSDARIRVADVVLRRKGQGPLVTEYANALITEGFHFVFPFDSDEFWNLDLAAVRKVAHRRPNVYFAAYMVQFVQDRRVVRGDPLSLLRAVHRAPALHADRSASIAARATAGCFTKRKFGFRSAQPVTLREGYHKVKLAGGEVSDGAEIFHLQLRSRDEIQARARRRNWADPFSLERDVPGGPSWWAANSVRNGCVDTAMGPLMMIPDRRLQALMARGLAWFALRHPWLLARALLICRRPLGRRAWSRTPTAAAGPLAVAPAE